MNNEFLTLLNKMYKEIFSTNEQLTSFEKRKRIFDYMVNNINYDCELLKKIEMNQKQLEICPRDAYLEALSVLKNHIGICNGIAQIYKLLLEKAGLYSVCVVCNNGNGICHQLNLVKTEDTYSFDDVTSAIYNELNNEFFDYDLEQASFYNQGNQIIKGFNKKYIVLPSELIYASLKLDENGINFNEIKDLNYDEGSFHSLTDLPSNISRFENKKHAH